MTGTVCFLAIWGSLNPMCEGDVLKRNPRPISPSAAVSSRSPSSRHLAAFPPRRRVAKELAGYKEGAEQVVFSLEHATGHKQA